MIFHEWSKCQHWWVAWCFCRVQSHHGGDTDSALTWLKRNSKQGQITSSSRSPSILPGKATPPRYLLRGCVVRENVPLSTNRGCLLRAHAREQRFLLVAPGSAIIVLNPRSHQIRQMDRTSVPSSSKPHLKRLICARSILPTCRRSQYTPTARSLASPFTYSLPAIAIQTPGLYACHIAGRQPAHRFPPKRQQPPPKAASTPHPLPALYPSHGCGWVSLPRAHHAATHM